MMGETDKFEKSASIIGQPEADVHDTAPDNFRDRVAGGEASRAEVAIPPSVTLPYLDPLADFEPTAADCLNRALQIAISLAHASFSSDHLMLALSMDPHARRHLQRVGDIGQLREAAMLRLGRTHWKFARRVDEANRFPAATSDVEEIRKLARRAAADREQKVAIADLINAFPTRDGRLVYGLKETTESVPAILERIENKLVPRVADFMSTFEAQLRESAERQIEGALRDFGEKHLQDAAEHQKASLREVGEAFLERHQAALEQMGKTIEERQLASLEAIGKQVQHDLETLAIVLKHFRDKLQQEQ